MTRPEYIVCTTAIRRFAQIEALIECIRERVNEPIADDALAAVAFFATKAGDALDTATRTDEPA